MGITKLIAKDKESSSLSEKVYEKILKDILTGTLASNTKLTEDELCKRLSTSRTPVREAMSRLEMVGLIKHVPNRGAFVHGLSESESMDIAYILLDLCVRASGWAAERMIDDEMEELTDILSFMEFYTKKNDISKMIDINNIFHNIIYRATHNQLLYQAIISYRKFLSYSCPPNCFAKNYLDNLLSEHRHIYSAIISRDKEAAEIAMRKHMEHEIERHFPIHFNRDI